MTNGPNFDQLLETARQAALRAYAPYSKFRVGAAALDDAGRVFVGCNVENASLGLSLCAERSALAAAVAGGAGRLTALALWFPDLPEPGPALSEGASTPCGACRQWLVELAPEASLVTSHSPEPIPIRELLPKAFSLG
ncbi:MAG: cytidine deaminase [Desulfovibrionaceae bacterium]